MTSGEVATNTAQKKDQIKAILFLLQTNMEEFKDELDRGYALYSVGEKTDLIKKIEQQIDDPFETIFQISIDIEAQVVTIVDNLVKSFLEGHRNLISSYLRSTTATSKLYYSIGLKDDNFKNRDIIFSFFDKYNLLKISERYPVYFQFTPIELLSKIKHTESISFE